VACRATENFPSWPASTAHHLRPKPIPRSASDPGNQFAGEPGRPLAHDLPLQVEGGGLEAGDYPCPGTEPSRLCSCQGRWDARPSHIGPVPWLRRCHPGQTINQYAGPCPRDHALDRA
jgi:hypothetical protein